MQMATAKSIKADAESKAKPSRLDLASEIEVTDPASEAWALIARLFAPKGKPRFVQIAHELGLAPQQAGALRALVEPVPMGDLATALHCDSSNVTGIVDRLEERGLVRREAAEGDRRVKMLVLTPSGERLRREITRRFSEPPTQLAALSKRDQKALRDILRRALGDLANG
jgi:MarR family transcriptional regulator, organic hydroperoxide resistance regulator